MTIRSVSALGGITAACVLGAALHCGDAHAACGDPNGDGRIVAGDALLTLRAAVGQTACALDTCDVDMSGTINAADALKLLRAAAGLPPPLACASVIGKQPTDPFFVDQYGLTHIHAPEAWNTRTDCSNTIVAVVDTGVDYYHDDLVDNLWTNPGEIPHNHKDDDNNGFVDDVHGYDFVHNDEYPWDPVGHGTHVAGIIGARSNDIGTVGVCWEAKIMAVRFISEDGFGFQSDSLQAVDYARKNGARVINNSWGGGSYDSGEYYALKAASEADIVLVMAAGNSNDDNDAVPTHPADFLFPNQINVAATTNADALATFSNFGATTVHIGAPGVDILSTTPYDTYSFFDGTSMAAPMVAGAATMIRAEFPTLTATEVKRAILNSAHFDFELEGLVATDGLLNVRDALLEARDIAFGAAFNFGTDAAAPAPAPKLRSRHVVESWRDERSKYPNLQKADEVYADGSTRSATMVADHLVVAIDNAGVITRIEKAGFEVIRRLATDRTTVLVVTPDGTEAAAAQLAAIDGVLSVDPDYVITLQ